mmetsp:Transcript_103019/g.177718  ORF Transcript_103019/g.177718 Transcript_103019/m.177718 type:complete len:223 (+) Transcript_103019:2361-3029(+)
MSRCQVHPTQWFRCGGSSPSESSPTMPNAGLRILPADRLVTANHVCHGLQCRAGPKRVRTDREGGGGMGRRGVWDPVGEPLPVPPSPGFALCYADLHFIEVGIAWGPGRVDGPRISPLPGSCAPVSAPPPPPRPRNKRPPPPPGVGACRRLSLPSQAMRRPGSIVIAITAGPERCWRAGASAFCQRLTSADRAVFSFKCFCYNAPPPPRVFSPTQDPDAPAR